MKVDKKEMSKKVKGYRFNEENWKKFCSEIENDQRIPKMNSLMELEQLYFYQLLQSFINRIIVDYDDIETNIAIWIYNLFCFIEFPLHSDISAVLNQLVSWLNKIRTEENYKLVNILLTIIIFYFQQGDEILI